MATANKMAYDAKYQRENYDTILVRVPKGMKDEIRTAAESSGISLNAYIVEAIRGTFRGTEALKTLPNVPK